MRSRSVPDVNVLKARAARKARRAIANTLSRDIRLGRIGLTNGSLHELVGHEHPCQECGEKGRVFWVSYWIPGPPRAPHLGWICRTPFRCGFCTARMLGMLAAKTRTTEAA